MTKKPPVKVKQTSSKINKRGILTKSRGRVLQMAQKTTPKKSVGNDPHFAQAVQNYEAGLRAMQEHKFEKAKTYLSKLFPLATSGLVKSNPIFVVMFVPGSALGSRLLPGSLSLIIIRVSP